MYEGMLREIRSLNQSLPRSKQVRVLLGDPPIDWSAVRGPADEDMNDWRDAHFAHVVERDVMDRRGKALLFIGGAHISRNVMFPNSLVHLLDTRFPEQTWIVSVLDVARVDPSVAARLERWSAPAAASVRGTWLGKVPVQQVGFTLSRPGSLEDDVDAVAVLGSAPPRQESSPPLESASHRELARRRALAQATLPFRGGRIRFEEGGALSAGATEDALQAVLAELVRDRELKLLVKAFADATEREPMALSTRRAERLVEWLTERGVERDRLVSAGCGALRPLNFGTTAAERAMNRRAELVRLTPTAGCEPPW
jgi:outer membrane protein OmpA-like peptidoglycan-associated protein